jgi:predicted RNA polymerase sigma factor
VAQGLALQAAEAHGLAALLELQASRLGARTDAQGRPILLADQDRRRWDPLLIRRGLAALEKAQALGGGEGVYALQAAIAACHARARSSGETDWQRIAALYATLQRVAPSPVIELNRAVAVAMAEGPAAGLEIVERLRQEPALRRYQWLPSVRGDLLEKLGRLTEAREAFLEAAELAGNARERELLVARAAKVAAGRDGAQRGGRDAA